MEEATICPEYLCVIPGELRRVEDSHRSASDNDTVAINLWSKLDDIHGLAKLPIESLVSLFR